MKNHLLGLTVVLLAGCPGRIDVPADGTVNDPDAADVSTSSDGPLFTDAACGASYAEHAEESAIHVTIGTVITYSTNPPSSGSHYGSWAQWGEHVNVVPRGY